MAESIVQVTEGSGKKLHTNSRTIGANTVEDEYVLPGEYALPTYTVYASGISIATANDHIVQLMAGSSSVCRIRRIRIEQQANASAVGLGSFDVLLLSTAGTGGTSGTPRKHDQSDSACAATMMTLPTVKGTEGAAWLRATVTMRSTAGATYEDMWEWVQSPNAKPIMVGPGTANGIAIKNITAIAAASVNIHIEFVETSFSG